MSYYSTLNQNRLEDVQHLTQLQQDYTLLAGRLRTFERYSVFAEFDTEGVLKKANARFNQAYHKQETFPSGTTFLSLFPEEEQNNAIATLETLLLGKTIEGELQLLDSNKNPFWLLGGYFPLYAMDGTVCGFVVNGQIINDYKQRLADAHQKNLTLAQWNDTFTKELNQVNHFNRQLDELQTQLNNHLTAVSRTFAVIEFNLDGTIITANENFLKTTGYAIEDIMGKHHRIFMFEEDLQKPEYAAMWKKLGAGEPLTGTFRRKTKDGSELWIMGSYNPMFDLSGKPYRLVKYVLDVTQQHREHLQLAQLLERETSTHEELRQNMEELATMHEELTTTRNELKSQLDAINRSNAVIEFELTGHIITANQNFLDATGYTLEEIRNKHHRIFMYEEDAAKPEYAEMWQKLGRGEHVQGTFKRRRKNGHELWIVGSYNPVLDKHGKPYKFVKYVYDVTHEKQQEQEMKQVMEEMAAQDEELRQNMEELATMNDEITTTRNELKSQLDAINRSNAVIEFELTGHIITANQNFLDATGYTLEEIRDKHHRIFMFEEDAAKPEYTEMWKTLGNGEFIQGVFRRRRKNGDELYIMGSYNPVLDKHGKPYKLIKYVFDVTHEKQQEVEMKLMVEVMAAQDEELRQNMEELATMNDELSTTRNELKSQLDAINRSNAVIEFELTGHIITANQNFLDATGYTLEEIRGKHHRIFMYEQDAAKPEYAEMWKKLGNGEFIQGVFRRRRKNGDELYIMGSYNPVLDKHGKPYKLIKYVFDVTHEKQQEVEMKLMVEVMAAQDEELRQNMEELATMNDEITTTRNELKSQLDAINRSNAVIEFELTGHIITANQNFLDATGYTLEEIRGKHHRIFMYEQDAAKPEYAEMWQKLGRGEHVQGTFKRRRKNGHELWIVGSYNPVLDKHGKPYKLIKYVFDVTQQHEQTTVINESIRYAQRLQTAMMPAVTNLKLQPPPGFKLNVLFEPRDVVSGDFYWLGSRKQRTVVAIGDGTGHGIPGSLMSIVGISTLMKLVEDRGITDPASILEEMDEEVQRFLAQESTNVQDTLEMSVCMLYANSPAVTLSSAMRPAFWYRGGVLEELSANRNPVGGTLHDRKVFENQRLEFQPGDCLYILSDGISDQMGDIALNLETKKWGRQNVRDVLLAVSSLPIEQRPAALKAKLTDWAGPSTPQTDDIVLMMIEYTGQ